MSHVLAELMAYADQLLQAYGSWAVGGSIFLEAFGAPVPAESLLVASSVLASQGQVAILPLLFAGWLGAILGDNVGYLIGRFGGRRLLLRHGKWIFVTESRLQYAERFFARYGGIIVLFARFLLVLRQLNGIIAGTTAMPWPRFLFYNALGATLWIGVWGGLTYWAGKEFHGHYEIFKTAEPYLIGVAVLTLVVIVHKGYRRWRRSKE